MKGYLYANYPQLAGRLDLLVVSAGHLELRRWCQMIMEALADAISAKGFRRAA
jgi:hypothetical protein